jgi:hypothetical protein
VLRAIIVSSKLSYETVLRRVVGCTVEDIDPPVFEDAELFS